MGAGGRGMEGYFFPRFDSRGYNVHYHLKDVPACIELDSAIAWLS